MGFYVSDIIYQFRRHSTFMFTPPRCIRAVQVGAGWYENLMYCSREVGPKLTITLLTLLYIVPHSHDTEGAYSNCMQPMYHKISAKENSWSVRVMHFIRFKLVPAHVLVSTCNVFLLFLKLVLQKLC